MKNYRKIYSLIFAATLLFGCKDNTPTGDGEGGNDEPPVDPREGCTGLIVEKEKTTYGKGETVSIDDLKVYLTNTDNSKKIEISDYTVSYWQDATDVGDISNLKAGRYQIWVEAKATPESETLSSFEFIYVNASIKSFKLDPTIGVFTQNAGPDVMMNTWRFNLTYTNGWVRQLSMASYGISYQSDSYSTLTAGSASVLVTYTEENAETRQALVPYTIL